MKSYYPEISIQFLSTLLLSEEINMDKLEEIIEFMKDG